MTATEEGEENRRPLTPSPTRRDLKMAPKQRRSARLQQSIARTTGVRPRGRRVLFPLDDADDHEDSLGMRACVYTTWFTLCSVILHSPNAKGVVVWRTGQRPQRRGPVRRCPWPQRHIPPRRATGRAHVHLCQFTLAAGGASSRRGCNCRSLGQSLFLHAARPEEPCRATVRRPRPRSCAGRPSGCDAHPSWLTIPGRSRSHAQSRSPPVTQTSSPTSVSPSQGPDTGTEADADAMHGCG